MSQPFVTTLGSCFPFYVNCRPSHFPRFGPQICLLLTEHSRGAFVGWLDPLCCVSHISPLPLLHSSCELRGAAPPNQQNRLGAISLILFNLFLLFLSCGADCRFCLVMFLLLV